VRREIVASRGEATIGEARFLEGHSDADVEALFKAARESDYSSLASEAQDLERAVARRARRASLVSSRAMLGRLRKRLSEIQAIDFFDAPGREAAEALLAGVEERLRPAGTPEPPVAASPAPGRRFVDRQARFTRSCGSPASWGPCP